MKKNSRNTKGKIVSAAWKLFYEQGYDDTTVEEIVEESGTSRGSFYHYFKGKEALLNSLSYLLDEKYEELSLTMSADLSAYDKLLYLNHELFCLIESSIDIELLAYLYSSQLITKDNDIPLAEASHMAKRDVTGQGCVNSQGGEMKCCSKQ